MSEEYERILAELPSSEILCEIREISDFIHANPECGYIEFKAADILSRFLEKHSFSVKRGLIDELPTSFRADYGIGKKIKLAVCAEYDALPELGHACGHNLIAACSLATALAVKKYIAENDLEDVSITVMGTPGEELLGGKVLLAEKGLFDEFDCVLMAHPYDITSTDRGAFSVARYDVAFHGKSSHAASAPELGINALDAMIMLFNGISLWRQQLSERSRVHGIITNGGASPNIIPDLTEAFFYLRAPDLDLAHDMEERFKRVIAAAADATGCTFDCECVSSYMPERVNRVLNIEFADCCDATDFPVERAAGTEWRASTDFGDVSQRVPSAHFFFDICGKGIPLHSEDFRNAAVSDFAFEQAMRCARAMASVLIRAGRDAAFRKEFSLPRD